MMAQQSVVPGSSSAVKDAELGSHKHSNVLPLISDLMSMKTTQSSPDRDISSGLENRPVPAALQRNDSRDTDTFQIFPMEVDNHNPPITAHSTFERGTGPEIQRGSSIPIPGSIQEDVSCDIGSGQSTKLTSNELTVSALHDMLSASSLTGSASQESVHKPPKPPKPAFLSELQVFTSPASEKVPVMDSGTTRQKRNVIGADPPFIAPREGQRFSLRLFNLSSTGRYQGHEAPKQIQKPWTSHSSSSSRLLSRPIQYPKSTAYALNEISKRPLPAPFPMVDEPFFQHDTESFGLNVSDTTQLPASDAFRQNQPQGERSFGHFLNTHICKPLQTTWLRIKENECAIVSLLIGQRSEQHLLSQSKSCSFHVHVNWPIAQPFARDRGRLKDAFVPSSMSTAHLLRVDIIVPLFLLRMIWSLKAALLKVVRSAALCALIDPLQALLHFFVMVLLFLLETAGVNVFIQPREAHSV
ncbi:uncharacterized protein BP01DRAFT_420110 [Aspergillus saccharolyticus JOP 1030-1]|uniref:Uncharacterized protein n=1 Tax=Aspergillus saccharolyticus JOP 1030-1 TaxID=1450539 RepID=A0A318ZTM6_9EURO|nr:hypothetical protein BP01DRAFT_420110 [Aspergillus saccharolyticus JOP 1030-1]PYH50024.1 hypothetical protein BP01DRAFT_420110 [Aspergillus saccharolyticus JOP 1030-1]